MARLSSAIPLPVTAEISKNSSFLRFASAFVELQTLRHQADYDPLRTFKRSDVLSMIELAERAILDVRAAPRPDLRAFAALVLLADRR